MTVDPVEVTTLRHPVLTSEEKKLVKQNGITLSKPRVFKYNPFMGPHMFTPAYLEVDYPTCSTVFLRSPLPQPNEVEVPSPFPPSVHQLCFEWYYNIHRRKEKQVIWKPVVVNGMTVKLKPKFDRMVRWDQKMESFKRRGIEFVRGEKKVKYRPRRITKK